jgi:hypothetical protein
MSTNKSFDDDNDDLIKQSTRPSTANDSLLDKMNQKLKRDLSHLERVANTKLNFKLTSPVNNNNNNKRKDSKA